MSGHRIPKEAFKNQESYHKYSCLACHYLLREAVQSALCGHWYCETCISPLLNTSDPVCLGCGESLKSDEDEGSAGYFPDKFVRRDIDALEMVCIYKYSGCDWEGTFGKLESHLSSCEFATCQERLTAEPSQHECKLVDFSCPLGCPADKLDNREKLEKHMKDSELTHTETLLTRIIQLEATVDVLKTTSSKPPDGGSGYMDSGLGSMESSRFAEMKMDHMKLMCKSTTVGGDRIVLLNADGVPMTAGLQAQMQEDRVMKVRHELDSVKRELKSKNEELSSLRAMVNKLEKTQQSKNADFEDKDFRLSLFENSNYDDTVVWKIPQFSQRMTDAESGKYTSIFSLPFYTGRYGYKMCLRLYILGDGIGKGNYMSLFFLLMKGEFDNILQWPFTHKVTFKLINQGSGRDVVDIFQPDPMNSSFEKPKSDMNIASGCPRFVSHADLKSGGYTMDDTVFIKCIVAIRHPYNI